MYTPMHRALGRGPSDVDYELLEACVAAAVPESESLDWKQTLPHETGKPDWSQEWAKDVAAMANTGGGCIVYGVVEQPGAGTASGLVDVGPFSDGVEGRLRQAAAAQVRPLVAGLQFIPVTSPDGQGHALVVRVPASAEVPHLLSVGKEGFKAPYRYGATTEWMTERMLEAAYQQRFRRAGDLQDHLASRYGAAERHAGHLIQGSGAWFVSAAVPVEPQPEIELSHQAAAARLQTAYDLFREVHGRPVDLVAQDLSTVPGLRRLIAGGAGQGHQTELHYDGSVTLVEQMRDPGVDGFSGLAVATDELESSVLRLVATIAATARAAGDVGAYAVMVGVAWEHPNRNLRFATPHPMVPTDYRLADRPLYEVETSTREVRADADTARLRDAARELALDLLRQAGVAFTRFIPRDT